MAPSKDRENEFYDYVDVSRVIGELSTGRHAQDDYRPGGECWVTAFAPDESRFAWSCGFRKVVIIPWNRYKNCLSSQNNQDEAGYQLFTERVSIDSGFPVCSLAFGTGTPEGDLVPVQRGYWTRFDFTKDLILATGHTNGRIRIWDPYNGKLLLELTDRMGPVNCLAFALDGSLRLVSGSQDSCLKVWDIADDGNLFKTLKDHHSPLRSVVWSPDSKILCSTGDKQKALIWNMEDYSLKLRLIGHYNDILSSAFSPDGAMIATASCDTRVIIWDTHSGEQLRVLNHMNPPPGIIYMSGSNNSSVRGVSFSPNGCHVVTICMDGLLRFWNLMTGVSEDSPVSIGHGIPDDIMLNCCYSPVGGAVAVGHKSGSVLFFLSPTMVPSLLHLSRMTVRRNLGNVTHDPELRLPHTLKHYLQYKQW